jgi:pyruvate dehydrogenase (quinone)
MAMTAADVLIERITEALRTRRDRIRFVQVRHEEAAAFTACGYAKFTGRLGSRCCAASPIARGSR